MPLVPESIKSQYFFLKIAIIWYFIESLERQEKVNSRWLTEDKYLAILLFSRCNLNFWGIPRESFLFKCFKLQLFRKCITPLSIISHNIILNNKQAKLIQQSLKRQKSWQFCSLMWPLMLQWTIWHWVPACSNLNDSIYECVNFSIYVKSSQRPTPSY